jgi:hypothetical protein
MDNSSMENLVDYMDSHNFIISECYSDSSSSDSSSSCKFIKILCKNTGDNLVVSLPSSYDIKKENSIEIIKFDTLESSIENKNIIEDSTEEHINTDYKEIEIEDIEAEEDNVELKESNQLLDQYKAIDIDQEQINILKDNITSYKQHLDRLKVCTRNIKYKLCIISLSSISRIDSENEIECFSFKKCEPTTNEKKSLYIIIDLDNFYNRVNNIHTDITKVYNNLYNIMENAHHKQTYIISKRLKQYSTLLKNINDSYPRKDKYNESIKWLKDTLINIKKQEEIINNKLLEEKRSIDNSSFISTNNRSLSVTQLEKDQERIRIYKDNILKLAIEIKSEHDNFIFDFDSSLFNSIKLFDRINTNLSKINVIK